MFYFQPHTLCFTRTPFTPAAIRAFIFISFHAAAFIRHITLFYAAITHYATTLFRFMPAPDMLYAIVMTL